MDIDKLSSEIGISPESYRKLIQTYIDRTTSDLTQLEIAIDNRNIWKIQEYCHHIKGASLNLELMDIFEIAQNMEDMANEDVLHLVKTGYTALREKFELLVHFFETTE